MARRRRAIAAIILAVLCAPGTFLRTDISRDPPETVAVEQVASASDTATPVWSVAGVWHYSADSLLFGGFSTLMTLPDGRLQAFSDRGARFTFAEPDGPASDFSIARQPVLPERFDDIRDMEASTRDPASGTYWIAFENDHAVHRFSAGNEPNAMRDLVAIAEANRWNDNSGAEAMVRFADGRFVILPETRRTGLIFPRDPVAGDEPQTFEYEPPVAGNSATDMAQLPDGRLLLLLRDVDAGGGLPPFASLIAIGPEPRADEVWAPEIALDLAGVIPRENYEGIAVRALDNGRVAVWLIADDNLSLIQRTLVAKLIFDPAGTE
ncbi:esterase-like activity of phytase family protein [Erythrobacter sp. GH1-10]|uniref:esterase-like activity of phytase family protein n=1 Tax=Erythrobacter sp. GH1-10 TaxID=3349334 RepID=UPI003877E480